MLRPAAQTRLRLAALGCLVGLVSCGGDAEPTPGAPEPERPAAAAAPSPGDAAISNSPPRILRVGFQPESPTADEAVRVVIKASDADGDPLYFQYHWKLAGAPTQKQTPRLLLRDVRKGDPIEVTVIASDGKLESEPARAETRIGNAAPHLYRVAVDPGSEIVAGTPIVLRPDSRDPDGDAVRFSYEWRVNDLRVQERGPRLTTDRLRRGDTIRAAVIASDGADESDPVETPRMTIVNAPPRITSLPGGVSNDGVFRYRVKAEDPDNNDTLQFHLEDAPPGMSIDHLSGAIEWTPSAEDLGTTTFSVVADDLQGGRVLQTVEVTVSTDAQPPAAKAQ
jgi:hypothetical protein